MADFNTIMLWVVGTIAVGTIVAVASTMVWTFIKDAKKSKEEKNNPAQEAQPKKEEPKQEVGEKTEQSHQDAREN